MAVKEFNYDTMVHKAFRIVVRDALKYAEQHGLPGSHHFYITFETNRPDVKIPDFLKEKHPDEITIVLQHQFWDLLVLDEFFEVSLSFNDSQERIHVPFIALKNFLDPSVKFGLELSPESPRTGLKKSTTKEEALETKKASKAKKEGSTAKVVTLDTFRKK